MLQSHRMTIIEDKDALDGASTALVRQRFIQWVAEEGEEELLWIGQGKSKRVEEEQGPASGGQPRMSPRYRFCIHIDESNTYYLGKCVDIDTAL